MSPDSGHERPPASLPESIQSIHDPAPPPPGSAQAYFAIFDHDLCYLYVNPAVAAFAGDTPDAMVGRGLVEVFPEIVETALYEELQQALAHHEDRVLHYFHPHFGRWYECWIYVTPQWLSLFALDITAQKVAEVRLDESERRLRLALAAACMVAWEWRPQSGEFVASDSFEAVFGLPWQASMRFPEQWIHPDDRDLHHAAVRRLLAERLPDTVRYRVLRPDTGQYVWLEVNGYPEVDHTGTVVRVYGITKDVTESQATGTSLTASEERFRRAIEAAHAMVYEVDVRTGEIVDIHGFSAVLGYESSDKPLSRTQWLGFVHPEDRAMLADANRAARALPGEVYTRQYRLRHQAGHHIWVEDTGRIYAGEQGKAARAIGTLVDITQRKEAEDARRESEERFRVAQELSLDAFTILDAVRDRDGAIVDFRWRYANPVSARVLKHPREELEGRCLLEVLPGNRASSNLFDLYVKVVETGVPHDVELPYAADGINGWYRNMAVKLGDGVAIYFSDITLRKQTEQALRASEERFAKAFWASPDALVISRVEDARILEVNENWEKLTGYTRAEGIGRTSAELNLYFDDAERPRLFAELQARGGLRNYEMIVRRRDGPPCAVSMSVETMTVEGVPAHISIFRDVSARKAAERDQRFLLALGDLMLQPANEQELLLRITEAVARHMDAAGCVFAEVDRVARCMVVHANGDASAGSRHAEYPFDSMDTDVLAELEAGHAVQRLPAPGMTYLGGSTIASLGEASFLGVPLLQHGVWTAGLWIIAAGPRQWTERDVALLQSVIDRTQLAFDAVRAQAALRRSEARFRAAFEQAPVGVIQLDADGRVTMANPAYCAMLGFAAGELVGRSPTEWTHPEDGPTAQLLRKNLLRGQMDTYTYDKRYIRKDGATIWVQVNAASIADGAGRPVTAVNIAQDITLRRQSEEQIAYQAFLLRNVRDAVIALDAEEHITVWNSGAEELYGWKAEEVLGQRVTTIVRTSSAPANINATKQVLTSGMPSSVEAIHYHCDGSAIHVEVVATALFGASGSLMGYVGISRDITERKRYEMALQALNETLEERVAERTTELERSNRELDQFAYVASHDLKAPLRAIGTLASWIAEDAAAVLPEASRAHLARLQGRIARMDALLDDLLAYSRAGRVRHPLEWVDMARLVHDIVDLLAPPPGLRVHVDAGMTALFAERVPLETVFRNLIGNAIKHHHDPARANITISARQAGAWMEFCVADDGPGIDPAFHERIFAIFQTLRPRDQVEGSGIGLTLVKKLVEMRGGKVTLESSPGHGAMFRFTWPAAAED